MRVRCKFFLTVLCLLFFSAQSLAQSSVWLASKNGNKVYLGGTIHMLRADDYPLPPEFETAYAEADNLYFEIDIDQMNDPVAQLGMLQRLMYTDGRTLQTELDTEAYTALSDYVANWNCWNFKAGDLPRMGSICIFISVLKLMVKLLMLLKVLMNRLVL